MGSLLAGSEPVATEAVLETGEEEEGAAEEEAELLCPEQPASVPRIITADISSDSFRALSGLWVVLRSVIMDSPFKIPFDVILSRSRP